MGKRQDSDESGNRKNQTREQPAQPTSTEQSGSAGRKTGDGSTGPGFFAPPDVNTPYQNPGYAAQTRIMSTLQPCFMNKDTWWTWFLHRTSCGVSMVRWIFEQADKGIRNRAACMERDNTKGFDKLQYDDQ